MADESTFTETETILVSSDDDNRCPSSQTTTRGRRLSEEWLPPGAASTPLLVTTHAPARSLQDEENELFTNIEQLIQDFVQRPNRQYPLTRIIQWTVDEPTKMEHVVVIVINRPSIVL